MLDTVKSAKPRNAYRPRLKAAMLQSRKGRKHAEQGRLDRNGRDGKCPDSSEARVNSMVPGDREIQMYVIEVDLT